MWDRAERGAPARQHLIRRGWPAAAVAALPDDAMALDTEHESGHRLVLPLFIDDDVVDVVGLGEEGMPRRRGKAKLMPVLGRIEEAVIGALGGEKLLIAVRPDDYLLARCLTALRPECQGGRVLGVPAVGALGDLLAAIRKVVVTLHLDPGSVELWVVRPAAAWTSHTGRTTTRGHDELIAHLRADVIGALDWARVRFPDETVPVRDLDAPEACWSRWETTPLLVHAGSHDWRITMRGGLTLGGRLKGAHILRSYLYRLPLHTVVRATHWRVHPRFGEVQTLTPSCTDFDLGDLVSSWLRLHGVETFHDRHGHDWAYWDRELMAISGGTDDRKAFEAKLGRLAHLNSETKAGRVVFAQVRADARCLPDGRLRSPREIRPWTWSDLVGGAPESRLALGDEGDRVVVARPGRVVVERNAQSEVLRRPKRSWAFQTIGPSEWSGLLYDRIGRWLTCEPALRLLEVAWCLMALLGRRLDDYAPVRPILWPIGPASSGKTKSAELFQGLIYGRRDPMGKSTPRSLMALAEMEPAFIYDNAEQGMREREMLELLLLAFLGAHRTKMRMNSDTGVVEQRIEAWFLLTSIEGGEVHELITRALFVRHDVREFGDPDHAQHNPSAEVIASRSELLSGAVRVWADRILPRLIAGEGRDLAAAYKERMHLHPLARQLGTLVSLAIIADVLAELEPRWGVGGAAALDRWLAVLGETTSEMMLSSDPIGGALRLLLTDFNAIDIGPNGPWQPLVETERVALQPIFEGLRSGYTLDRAWAKKRRARGAVEAHWPIVVGWVGTYTALHGALHERTRSRGTGYAEQIRSPDILARRMHHCEEWHTVDKIGRENTGGRARRYAWVLDQGAGVDGEAVRRALAGVSPWAGTRPDMPADEPECSDGLDG